MRRGTDEAPRRRLVRTRAGCCGCPANSYYREVESMALCFPPLREDEGNPGDTGSRDRAEDLSGLSASRRVECGLSGCAGHQGSSLLFSRGGRCSGKGGDSVSGRTKPARKPRPGGPSGKELRPENRRLLAYLKAKARRPDEKGDVWWDEFRDSLRKNPIRLGSPRQA